MARVLMDRLYKRSLSAFNETKRTALQNGACELLQECTSEAELLDLFFIGAGREFCKLHQFPPIETARKWSGRDPRVYVDEGEICIREQREIALVGDTDAVIYIKDVNQVHKLYLLHGAKAKIFIEPYCFLVITRIGEGTQTSTEHKGKGAVIVDD